MKTACLLLLAATPTSSWHLAPGFRVHKSGPGRVAMTLSRELSPVAAEGPQQRLTTSLQALHVSAAAGWLLEPGLMDAGIAALWQRFDAVPATHHCMFEACLAVAAFVVWIAFFEALHLVLPNAAEHRLDGRAPVRPLHGFGPEIHKSVVPAAAYLGSIAVFHHFHLGPLLFGVKPAFDAPSFGRVVTEVASGVLLYDMLFYSFHWSFHSSRAPRFWKRLHSRHHRWAATETSAHNAIETVQNSYVDAGIQVAINICVQQLSPWGYKHPLSRVLHNLMVTYLLTESHSGYDLGFMSHRLFPGVFGGAPRHEAHHRGAAGYHQFFTYLDHARGADVTPWDRRGAAPAATRAASGGVQPADTAEAPEALVAPPGA